MSMIPGAVTVADDGSATGSGMALAIFTARVAAFDGGNYLPLASGLHANLPDRVKVLRAFAIDAVAHATGIVSYVQANAVVSLASVVATVSAGQSLGATPNPNNAATAITGPGAAVPLPVTGAAGATTLGVS